MVKAKKSRIDSDALLRKKSLQGVKKPNPFEIQVSKSKFTILNRDSQTSNHRFAGVPGVQRARAIEKRKQTLGQEFLLKNKSNRFTDQRKDGRNMSRDQMASERKSTAVRRKEMFNLNESVKLTHRGQTLEEIERFDDAVDNDDSDEDGGQLDADFMEAAHFGGGEEDGEDHGKDRKTVIEEMIAESKRRKAEKQRENDEVYEMTQKLDQNWQSLMSVVGNHMKGETVRPQLEDYDKIMREMIFDRRGAPADKLKSEEELARIEKQKLEKLERERLARMNGEDGEVKGKHRSADDLDDGYLLQPVDGNEEATYDEGDVDAEDGLYNPREISKEANKEESVVANDGDGISEDEESQDEEESDSETEDDVDNLSDLKEDSESESEVDIPIVQTSSKKDKTLHEPDPAELAAQEARKKAESELPFTFELPRKYEQLEELLHGRSPEEHIIILERMIKSNNAKFSRENKQKMISLYAFLLQYLNDLFVSVRLETLRDNFRILRDLSSYLYDLAKINPSETAQCFLDVIKEKQEEYRKKPRQYPQLDSLIFLKLVPVLYSASDFRHPIVTPALVFISQLLSRCQVRNRKDITSGLFLVTTMLECVEQSKRFLPAVLNFLNGVLYVCFRKRSVTVVPVVPPFKSSPPLNNLLALDETTKDCGEQDFVLSCEDFVTEEVDDSFKLRALGTTLELIITVFDQLQETEAIHQLVIAFVSSLERIDEDLLPAVLKKSLNETLNSVKALHLKPLFLMVAPKQKPKPLRLLEPKIEAVYDDIRRRPKSQPLSDRDKRRKLQQKVKKESRAAAREIRQDNEFIAKLQFKQRAASDRERKDKVKRIFSEASSQQGELKSYDRKAKYKK
ncbi:nucleolar protein 14 homolog [Armigeres subalbatus]|uniref:nucleolar protein 14 homolog n=1 Tax=Armigeres subalbatus TaxID=124917 RepID=UPI002ED0C05D